MTWRGESECCGAGGGRKNVGMDGGYGSGAIKVTEGVVIEFKGVIRVGFFTVICR